ncbi:MAG: cache domain-containing protein [Deltaproteobacteria bacterium]|nr:cache domain-containing protein [Deltaproteobacteria bacterium]
MKRVFFANKSSGKDVFFRILFPVLITFALFLSSIYLLIIPYQENAMMAQKRVMIKELIESAYYDLEYCHQQEEAGIITSAEAREKALKLLSLKRYGSDNKNYFWVNDMTAIMLMHPYRADLVGKYVKEFQDPAGKYLFKEFIKTVETDGSGYVDYMWQWKDNPSKIVPKISFVKGFKPWGWIIGTGVYIEDVKNEMNKTRHHLEMLTLIILLFVAMLCVYIILQARKIDNEKHLAMEQVSQSEKRHRTLIETAPEGIILINSSNGQIDDANPAALKIFNLELTEIKKYKIWELNKKSPHDEESERRRLESLISDALKNDLIFFEWTFQNFSSESETICDVRFVKVPNDTSTDLRASIVDITDRKNSEKKIIELRNYLADVINSMPSVLIGIDENMIVTEFNKRAEIYSDVEQSQIKGSSALKVFPVLYSIEDQIAESVKRRKKISVEKLERKNDNGKVVFETFSIFPLKAEERNGAVILIDDITKRVQLEETVIQSKKMLSVGGLAAGMAHEINNPLAGIILSAGILKRRLMQKSTLNSRLSEDVGLDMDAFQKFMSNRNIGEIIDNISDAGARAASIIQNMLDFSRQTDLKMNLNSIPILMDKCISLMTANAYNKKLSFSDMKITRSYEKGLPDVPCDSIKIQQVFINLLQNGVDAISDRKDIPDRWEPEFVININHLKDDNIVRIKISDNGPGIDIDDTSQIFEPFFTTKEPGEGTGLGLSISYFIITDNHKGKMSVKSKRGKGTTFIIDLPV